MTNDDLSKFVDTSDEWIQQRTGVKERRFSHVNTSDMAEIAGKHAIACAGLNPEDIDVVILATCTPDSICLLYTSPSPRDEVLSRMPSSA